MRVMCIKKDEWVNFDGTKSESKDPVFGEICQVTNKDIVIGIEYYSISNYYARYRSNHFIPLSYIEETELINEKQLLNT